MIFFQSLEGSFAFWPTAFRPVTEYWLMIYSVLVVRKRSRKEKSHPSETDEYSIFQTKRMHIAYGLWTLFWNSIPTKIVIFSYTTWLVIVVFIYFSSVFICYISIVLISVKKVTILTFLFINNRFPNRESFVCIVK